MTQIEKVRLLAELLAQEVAKITDDAPRPSSALRAVTVQPPGQIPPMPAVPPPVHPSNAATALPVQAFGGQPMPGQ